MDSAAALEAVNETIARTCKIAKRDRAGVTLIAVSKTHPVEKIEPLLEAGHRVFGENRVQEAQAKWPELRERYDDVELHLIGQLQSNKAEDATATFDVIHSLDRPSLLKALAMEQAGGVPDYGMLPSQPLDPEISWKKRLSTITGSFRKE